MAQGPDCDCETFIGILGVFLPVVNVLPLFVIVYLVASTVFDLYASHTLNPSPFSRNPNPPLPTQALALPHAQGRALTLTLTQAFHQALISPKPVPKLVPQALLPPTLTLTLT